MSRAHENALAPRAAVKAAEEQLERWAQAHLADEPFSKLVGLVGLGALIFHRAEVGRNPKVKSYLDALLYVSTCASVGYGDIFPVTPVGKLLGTFVMTVGPAMASAAFVGGRHAREAEQRAAADTQHRILTVMEAILVELKQLNAPKP